MIRPALTNLGRQRGGTSRTVHLPAPVKGWNTRDPIADMDPLNAVQLQNWFPRAGELSLRGGYQAYATGLGNAVKSLFQYSGNTTTKLFGATDSGIFDCSSPGAVGAAAVVLTNGVGKAVNFTNPVGTCYLLFMNGVDTPKMFDGAAWSVPTITGTGLTTTNCIAPWCSKRRVWFVEKGTTNTWYLPVDSIQGVASKFPLGALFNKGGYLVAGASWTLDAGDGADDYNVFISSEGQAAVYKGTDPSSASSWALIGVFMIGKPIGRDCFFSYGGDIGVITEGGVFPFSKALGSAVINYKSAVTDPIMPTMRVAAAAYKDNTGWMAVVYPAQQCLLINVPVQQAASAVGVSVQYVMNTVTGAWTSFTGWNAGAFCLFNGILYFGDPNGAVNKAWDGAILSDAGADIKGFSQQAYNYLGGRGSLKRIQALRPSLSADDSFELKLGLDCAFSTDLGVAALTTTIPRSAAFSNASYWNLAVWNTAAWSSSLTRFNQWRSPSNNAGFAQSLLLQVATVLATVTWSGTDLIITDGGIL